MTLERGALLHKRYRIVEILGQGGMGSVYRAVDENLGVDVAVKENLFTTDEYARQFRLEAVILANLRHPNLPRVTDHFVIGDQGQYLVMDYIEGEDLRQRMERAGNITEDEAILMGAAMCDALTYLHTRKPPILHRDIKPGNVKITPDGHIFLVDFGLAKVLHGSQATTTGARAMTPGYSPPEQYGTARTDPRTDIYSLGATIYAALTGIIPEDGLARAMDNTQLTPLRKRNNKVSKRLAAAVEKAMGIDPADRFQNAEDFKRALLGSKSKTQRLPGEYVIPPPPPEPLEEMKPALIEGESQPVALSQPGLKKNQVPVNEPPVFKPKRKRRSGRRVFSSILVILFLMAFTVVGAARFRPDVMPPQLRDALSPVKELPLPFLDPGTSTPTTLPSPTQGQDSQATQALPGRYRDGRTHAYFPPFGHLDGGSYRNARSHAHSSGDAHGRRAGTDRLCFRTGRCGPNLHERYRRHKSCSDHASGKRCLSAFLVAGWIAVGVYLALPAPGGLSSPVVYGYQPVPCQCRWNRLKAIDQCPRSRF